MPLFGSPKKSVLSDKYTHAIGTPQYLPANAKPNLAELYDYTKYAELLAHINASDVSEDEKKFLRLAASRHIVFRYDKIADYYAHSNAEMQKLMEESALVIIDFEDAIMSGYVDLSKEIQEIVDRSKSHEE